MSEGVKSPDHPHARGWNPQDLSRGLVPFGMALFAFWCWWTLPGLSGGVGLVLLGSGLFLTAAAATIIVLGLQVRNPQDYYGGLALIALALFAFWAGSDLPGLRGFSFGPGTAPRLFSGMLLAFGVLVTVIGLFTEGQHLERYAIRGPVFVTAGILFFAVAIRPLGLVVSSFAAFLIAAIGAADTRWVESVIAAAALTAFCSFLFPYVLNLPFQLWPRFWY